MKKRNIFNFVIIILLVSITFSNYKTKNNLINTSNKLTFGKPKYSDNLATIEIPSINLSKHLYKINSNKNNVNTNLMIIRGSVFPWDSDNSNIIIAGHSGNGYNAFFNNLKHLNKGNYIYLYYKNIIYKYIIYDTYSIEKNGIYTYNEIEGSIITLITCDTSDNRKQLVFIGKLK